MFSIHPMLDKIALPNSSCLKKVFKKLRFRNSEDGRPNQENKTAFSNSSGAVATEPNKSPPGQELIFMKVIITIVIYLDFHSTKRAL